MAELEALQRHLGDIRATGADVVAISPTTMENARRAVEDGKLDFDILRDEENDLATLFGLSFRLPEDLAAVYAQFGIVLPDANGEDSGTLPMPARYIIGKDRKILDAQVHADYTQRPEPEDTLDFLKSLA